MNSLLSKVVLFFIFLKIGTVAFGGAYSIWSMVDQEFVTPTGTVLQHWNKSLSESDLYKYMEVGRMTPGPNINGVLLVGYYFEGLWGILLSLVALLLPSGFAIVGLYHLNRRWKLSRKFSWFKEGALAGVIGVLIFFLVKLLGRTPHENILQIVAFWSIFVISFALIHIQKANIILVTLFSGLVTWSFYWLW